MLSDEDVRDLSAICRANVESPAFYKDGYHFNASGRNAAAVLRRQGYKVLLDDDNRAITIERAS